MIRLFKAWFNRTFRKAKLEGMLKSIKFQAEVSGAFEAQMEIDIPGLKAFTDVFVQMFQQMKAVNYLDFTSFDHATMEAYTISIQKQSGRKPGEINQILRECLTVLYLHGNLDHDMQALTREALQSCGYLDQQGEPTMPL